jgi:hypothetical protein
MSSAPTSGGTPSSTPDTGTTGTSPNYRGRNPRSNGGRGGTGNRRNQNTRSGGATNAFKGTVKEMNGHVFQCYGEATEKNQFARTVDELDTYVGLHFKKHPIDMKRMIKSMTDTIIPTPTDHADTATKTEIRIWEKEVDMMVLRRVTYDANKCTLYSVIWNQCSESMQAKIRSSHIFEIMSTDSNSLTLLLEIKGIAYKFESQKNIYLALDNAKSAFYA